MTTTALAPPPVRPSALGSASPEVSRARSYASAARAESTGDRYAREWRAFASWCAARGVDALPSTPDTLACYVAHLADAGRAAAGIDVALSAVSQVHHAGGHDGRALRGSAPVRAVRSGVRRTLGTAQRQVSPLTSDVLVRIVEHDVQGLAGIRDRVLLLLGFATSLRRSELVALEVRDLSFGARGVEVTIRRSKTDQEGAGRTVAVRREVVTEVCPVAAIEAWIKASGVKDGPLLRAVDRWGNVGGGLSGEDIARRVKAFVLAIGLDPAAFSGHSLRSGLATSAALAGKSDRAIMAQTGHKSRAMVDRYVRAADRWKENAAAGLLSAERAK